jgi:hypothetical protein
VVALVVLTIVLAAATMAQPAAKWWTRRPLASRPATPALVRNRVLAAALLVCACSWLTAGVAAWFFVGALAAGPAPAFTFLLAIVAIYLILAAQFESFVHPFTIMLALPLATVGALAGLYFLGMNLSVYGYIGLIMLMGLVTKNSILLVDCANQRLVDGVTAREAVTIAGRTRLRPILMTAVSTIVGVLPIALGLGAGAESRRPLGIAVVVGMTTSTLLTLVVVPVVYTLLSDAGAKLRRRTAGRRESTQYIEGRA